jgi:hypothetical protein
MLKPGTGLVLLPLLTAALAGCLQDETARVYYAAGQDGYLSLGQAYDGKNVLAFNGAITIIGREAENTGLAHVQGFLAPGSAGKPQVWDILFDRFAEQANRTFQDGGIAADLEEHGDSGNGDASIPRVHADLAGWGEATINVDGKPSPDPLTGQETWVAHYMVLTTGVRDDATHQIWNQAKSAPYDPANPGDGFAQEGDNEIHLRLSSHATAPPAPVPVDEEGGPVDGITFRETHTWNNRFKGSAFNATLTMEGGVVPNSYIIFQFRDPDNQAVGENSYRLTQPAMGDPEPQQVHFTMNKAGNYSVNVNGNAIQATYKINGTITPPGNVLLNFWWEDVIFGEAARTFEPTFTTSDDNATEAAELGPAAYRFASVR